MKLQTAIRTTLIFRFFIIPIMVFGAVAFLLGKHRHFEKGCYQPLGNYEGNFCWMLGHIQWKAGDYDLRLEIGKNVELI